MTLHEILHVEVLLIKNTTKTERMGSACTTKKLQTENFEERTKRSLLAGIHLEVMYRVYSYDA